MTVKIGRNRNTNDEAVVTTVEINSTTATTLVAANPRRMGISISLDGGTDSIQVFIRLLTAGANSNKQGDLLTRRTTGNDTLFESIWRMSEGGVYTGEISAISVAGTFNLHITEF